MLGSLPMPGEGFELIVNELTDTLFPLSARANGLLLVDTLAGSVDSIFVVRRESMVKKHLLGQCSISRVLRRSPSPLPTRGGRRCGQRFLFL